MHGLKLGDVHRSRFGARVETLLTDLPELRLAIAPFDHELRERAIASIAAQHRHDRPATMRLPIISVCPLEVRTNQEGKHGHLHHAG